MTPLRFTLTEAMAVRSAQLHGGLHIKRWFAFGVVVAILATGYFLLKGSDLSWKRVAVQLAATLVGTLAMTSVILALLHFFVNPFYARKNYRQQKQLSQEMTFSWTQQGYLYECGNSRSDMPYTELYGYRVFDDIIVLYLTEALMHVIPTSAFETKEQAHSFIQDLEAASVRKR